MTDKAQKCKNCWNGNGIVIKWRVLCVASDYFLYFLYDIRVPGPDVETHPSASMGCLYSRSLVCISCVRLHYR